MIRIAIKGVLAHRRRLLSTSLAILLGISFLCGTLVLGDTAKRSFNELLATANAGTDAYVRSSNAISAGEGAVGPDRKQRAHIDASLVDVVRRVDGVAAADPGVMSQATILDKNGKELGSGGRGAPSFGGAWRRDPKLEPFHVVDGAPPAAADDVVIDKATVDTAGFHVGDSVTIVVANGAHVMHMTGVVKFGTADSPAGANYALFTLSTAERLLSTPGKIDAIAARAAPGVSQDELVARIHQVMPADIEVLTGAAITKEEQDAFQSRISGFTTFFSAFGYIAVLVGAFVIYNTFSIIVAQRTREMALLRALGARRTQVLGSVMLEAVTVGLLASGVGVALGIGVGALLRAFFDAVGFGFPPGGLVLNASTVITGFVVGTVVTLFAALMPAVRASRVAPLAALREVAVDTSSTSRARQILGVLITAFGVLLVGRGVAAKTVGPIGLGAMLTLVGMIVVGPVVARPVSYVLGSVAPRVRGVAGSLARQNAMRNPRRTSGTAAALMVGVAVVTLFATLGASLKATVSDQIGKTFVGDFVVSSGTGFRQGTGFTPDVAKNLAHVDGVSASAPFRFSEVEIDGSSSALLATDPVALDKVVHLDVQSGSLASLGSGQIGISKPKSTDAHIGLGDTITVTYPDTGPHTLTVAAIFGSNDLLHTSYLVSTAFDDVASSRPLDSQILIKLQQGASPREVRSALIDALKSYPIAKVQDIADVKQQLTNRVNGLLAVLFGMLGLSIIIATIGISNTLQLSVHERTHELGLLRAVGTTRPQLRSMVRWESAIIALFGTVGGLMLGGAFGWAIVNGLGRDRHILFRIPVGQAVMIVVVGALVGVLAAARPASRAAKLDVLRAIATE